jgi:hypothetical protein
MMKKLVTAILVAFSLGGAMTACHAGAGIGPVHAGGGVR